MIFTIYQLCKKTCLNYIYPGPFWGQMVYIIQYDKENVALQLTGHQLMQNKKNW